jgi:hypothetical protein
MDCPAGLIPIRRLLAGYGGSAQIGFFRGAGERYGGQGTDTDWMRVSPRICLCAGILYSGPTVICACSTNA